MHNPHTSNSAVAGSGTVIDVTISVPAGVGVASGRVLTTLPDVDSKFPASDGIRTNEKKSSGKFGVQRSALDAVYRETPTKVMVGVTCNPMTESSGTSPGVVKLKDVT
jgi:hypothetical protein